MKWGSNMKCTDAVILEQKMLVPEIYQMILQTEAPLSAVPGQFVQVQVPGYYLRRPISICEINDRQVTLIYKTVGQGTGTMSQMNKGDILNLFGPLGTGFPILQKDPVLIGGGVGIPPLLETAKQYRSLKKNVTVILGFNKKEQIFLAECFAQLGCRVIIATMDGSYGIAGTVMDAMHAENVSKKFVLSCGPMPMLKAVSAECQGYISLESRMACGIGACMGCVVKDSEGGSLRVCKDGPVFAIGKAVL
jgi:dihydroorotate dehydrogenase electron transfer subunit